MDVYLKNIHLNFKVIHRPNNLHILNNKVNNIFSFTINKSYSFKYFFNNKTICLSKIVQNEEANIVKCLTNLVKYVILKIYSYVIQVLPTIQ
jgi:hypothetical protein